MIRLKWVIVVLGTIFSVILVSACGSTEEQVGQELEVGNKGDISGIMLAGEDAPEVNGTFVSAEEEDEVIITVNGNDVIYRLSEDAKRQVDNNEVEQGIEVTFTTYSIGDAKETIDKFIIK
ncbi:MULTISPECIES: hypothetical protein [Bacillaceae]|uniref:Lipoprotein n=1 Tax=Evansella alkalicola TaxID=745819 RepID=A0ABS6JYJ0_9BACI|nr:MULTISPECIES: hypothetical protein [Bacillaceae]MBU9723558.1 hypothetical protein [Bacillus alkalicola]